MHARTGSTFSSQRLALLALLFAAACGGGENDCDKAIDKGHSCGVTVSDSGECTGAAKCLADCVDNASCQELSDALAGTMNAFSQCATDCGAT